MALKCSSGFSIKELMLIQYQQVMVKINLLNSLKTYFVMLKKSVTKRDVTLVAALLALISLNGLLASHNLFITDHYIACSHFAYCYRSKL